MATMVEIERLTRQYARDHALLSEVVGGLQAAMEVARRDRMRSLLSAVRRTKESRAALHTALADSRDLFEKPKTLTIDGVKVGYQKQPGALSFDDGEAVCRLIRKHLPELVDTLINTTEKPVKAALANLAATDLKRIGVSVTDDTDAVLIKDTTSDVEKLVKKLLGDEEEVPE